MVHLLGCGPCVAHPDRAEFVADGGGFLAGGKGLRPDC